MANESGAWKTLRAHLSGHIQRFEDQFSAGIPDSNLCFEGMECWLEGKKLKEYPKRGSSLVKVGIRREQNVWASQRDRAGGLVIVWARVPDGWALFSGAEEIDEAYHGLPLAIWQEKVEVLPNASECAATITLLMEGHYGRIDGVT